MVDFRINETLQIGRRCFQLRRFNPPQHLCGAVRKTHLPFSRLVGAVSNCAYRVGLNSVRLETAPTGERKCLFIFTIHQYIQHHLEDFR